MSKIKIGQIGIGHNHAEGKMLAVRKFPNLFEVIGFAEDNEKWLQERGHSVAYQGLKRYAIDELIEKCDAILVETEVCNLTENAKKCVQAGKHIHMDKPASGTLEEYKEILSLAEKQNLTVQIVYMYRYNLAVQKCMDKIRLGELGEIYQIDAEMSTYHSADFRKWLSNFKGGSMYIFGSHLLDLIVAILGEPKKVVSCIKQTGFNGVYADDNCFAMLEFDKAIAKITNLSVEVNGWAMRKFVVMGSKGTVEIKPLEVNVNMNTTLIQDVKSHYFCDASHQEKVFDTPTDCRYDEMMKDFYAYILGDKKNPFTYKHDYTVQKVLLQIVSGK